MIIYSNYSVLNLFIPIMGRSLTHESEVVTDYTAKIICTHIRTCQRFSKEVGIRKSST